MFIWRINSNLKIKWLQTYLQKWRFSQQTSGAECHYYTLEVFIFLDRTLFNHHFFREDWEPWEQKEWRERDISTAWQAVGLLYLDNKMAASAGTKSLPFNLITSPTLTCENKVITSACSQQKTNWREVWFSHLVRKAGSSEIGTA